MGVHTVDLVIFGTGLLGIIHLAVQFGPSLPQRVHQLQESIETSCWTPAELKSPHVEYTNKVCSTKLTDFLKGRSSAEEAADIVPVTDPPQPASNSSPSTGHFAKAVNIVQSQSSLGHEVKFGALRDGLWYASNMATITSGLTALVVGGFMIAVCFSRAALMHGCLLEAAWRRAGAEAGQERFNTEGDVNDALPPDQPASMVVTQLSMLANSNTLSTSYLLFVVSLLLIFLMCGGLLTPGSTLVTPDISSQESGLFLCNFTVRFYNSQHKYSVQCHYDVSKKSNGVQPSITLLEIEHAMTSSCCLAFLMAFLLTLHAVNHFVLSPLLQQKTLLPMVRHLGVDVSSSGLRFGLTDLYFVSTYVSLCSQALYTGGHNVGGTELRYRSSEAVKKADEIGISEMLMQRFNMDNGRNQKDVQTFTDLYNRENKKV